MLQPQVKKLREGSTRKERIQKINKLYDEGHIIVYWTARGTMTGTNWYEITRREA